MRKRLRNRDKHPIVFSRSGIDPPLMRSSRFENSWKSDWRQTFWPIGTLENSQPIDSLITPNWLGKVGKFSLNAKLTRKSQTDSEKWEFSDFSESVWDWPIRKQGFKYWLGISWFRVAPKRKKVTGENGCCKIVIFPASCRKPTFPGKPTDQSEQAKRSGSEPDWSGQRARKSAAACRECYFLQHQVRF